MKLLISNPTEVPLEAFTLLGISTARNSTTAIGQFGSGAKHAILTLLRHNIPFTIYSGTNPINFSTRTVSLSNVIDQQILVNGESTSLTLGFGALDWTNSDMALRELICNALDQGAELQQCVSVVSDSEVHGVAGETRVYVDLLPAVMGFYVALPKWFICNDIGVLPAAPGETVRLYRKGVLVTDSGVPGKFHYNDRVGVTSINECRNLVSSNADYLGAILPSLNEDTIMKILTSELDFEKRLEIWNINYDKRKFIFEIIAKHADVTIGRGDTTFLEHKENFAGKRLVVLSDSFATGDLAWRKLLVPGEITFLPPPPELTALYKEVFSKLQPYLPTKPAPTLKTFIHPSTRGLCRGRVVALRTDDLTSVSTMVEELIHYHFEVPDNTRLFQEASISIIAGLIG